MPALEVEYRNAALRVEIDSDRSARLFINNIQRMHESLTALPGTLRLSSSVQTDYEWHEFIEAIVTCDETETTVLLTASNAEIACETYAIRSN